MRTQIACEILNNIGADIEDRMEVYREAASAASGQLQAFTKIKEFIATLKRNKNIDKVTFKLLEAELIRNIQDAERQVVVNVSKRDAFQDTVSYLKAQYDNFNA